MQITYPDYKARTLIGKEGLCWKCQDKPLKMFISYEEITVPLCWDCRDDFWRLEKEIKNKVILHFQR